MRGGRREGAGRPAGVPNRVTTEVRELLQPLDEFVIRRLVELMESKDEAIAFKATELNLAYRFGRPKAAVELQAPRPQRTIRPEDLEDLPIEELRQLAGLDVNSCAEAE